MKLSPRLITFLSLLLVGGCAGTHESTLTDATNPAALAQDYPTKPVRVIEPFGPGGGPDLVGTRPGPEAL